MDDFLPSQYPTSWKFYLFTLRFQSLRSFEVTEHCNSIVQIKKKISTSQRTRLNSEKFWEQLSSSSHPEAIAALHLQWIQFKPFANFSTKELLILLQNHIIPLESSYQHIMAELMIDQTSHEQENSWRPQWFNNMRTSILSQTRENILRLNGLTQAIKVALLQRGTAYKRYKTSRRMDDIEGAIAQEIDMLKACSPPLNASTDSRNLSDDLRMMIYRLLLQPGLEDELINSLISPIPKYGQTSLYSSEEVEQGLINVRQFSKTILCNLNLSKYSDELFSARNEATQIASQFRSVASKTFIKIQQGLMKSYIFRAGRAILQLKTVLLTIIFLIIFFNVNQLLIPFLMGLGGTSFSNLISGTLFLSFGIAPLWWLAWSSFHKWSSHIMELMVNRKKQEIIASLQVLENSERFIATQLSVPVLDIAFFDINFLRETTNSKKEQLTKAVQKVQSQRFWEKTLHHGVIQDNIEEIVKRIHNQQDRIDQYLHRLSVHLAQQIGKKIDRLKAHSKHRQLVPVISKTQLQKLEEFILQVGNAEAKHQYTQSINVINKWIFQLKSKDFSYEIRKSASLNEPWGGREIDQTLLKGWEVTLNAFEGNDKKKMACLQLNEILMGNRIMSTHEFNKIVYDLDPNNEGRLSHAIQDHIFATLQQRRSDAALLLGARHKQLISGWYCLYRNEIEQAKNTINQIFLDPQTKDCQMDDNTLQGYSRLLNRADFYFTISGDKLIYKNQNIIKKYFDNYQGQHALAYRLVRYLPVSEQGPLTVKIAKKRIDWIIEHLGNGINASHPFTKSDLDMLQSDQFLNDKSFNLCENIEQNERFSNPWDPHVETFLRSCDQNGLDTKKLLERYIEQNIQIKPFILYQQKMSTQANPIRARPPRINARLILREKDSCSKKFY